MSNELDESYDSRDRLVKGFNLFGFNLFGAFPAA